MADELVGGGTWVLRGTPAQNAILRPVFDPASPSFIAIPWDKAIRTLRTPIPISWDDLNDGTLSKVAKHTHLEDADGNIGHPTSRPLRGIAGVFWSDGRIKIDISLESRPDSAREVLSAEIAHAVDFGLPFTDDQKRRIMKLIHPAGDDNHTWWEVASYGGEYYTLGGETNMALFTHAYSQMEPYQAPFVHKSTRAISSAYREIVGIPALGQETVVRVRSKSGYLNPRYHRPTCYLVQPARLSRLGASVVSYLKSADARAAGASPCGICKPV